MTSGVKALGGTVAGGLKVFTAGIGAAATGLSALGAASIKAGSNFEAEMSKVAAISGATGEEFEALKNKSKEMGASTKFSATESAQAMEYMAMAGWKTEDMLSGIDGIMNLAAASGEDLATTSDIVTDALTAFGLSASDSTHFADILAAASSNANTNVSMMGETFKYVAPVAGALGFSAEDCATAIGLMANSGIKASQAGTALRAIFSRIVKPTDEVAAAMKALDISVVNSDGSMKSLNEIMMDLREGFSGLSEAEQSQMAAAIGGQEAMSGLLAIVNASDSDFEKLQDSIYGCDGAAAQMAETMQDNLQGSITTLKSAIEGLEIEIYESMESGLSNMAQIANSYISELTEAFQNSGAEGLASALGVILADLATRAVDYAPQMIMLSVGLVDALLGGIQQNLPQILDAGGEIVLSLASGIIAIFPMFASVAYDIIMNLLTGITDNADSMLLSGSDVLLKFITGIASRLPDLLAAGVDAIVSLAMALTKPETLGNIISSGGELTLGLLDGLMEAVPKLLDAAPVLIARLASSIVSNIPKLLSVAVEILTKLSQYMINNVLHLLSAVPKLFISLVNEFKDMDWGSIGKNIIDGIWSGISGGWDWLVGQVKALANSLFQGAKDALDIHSPSRKFRWVGEMCVAGMDGPLEEYNPYDTVRRSFKTNPHTLAASFAGTATSAYTVAPAVNYDKMASVMVSAFERAGLKVEIGHREFGRIVREVIV